MQVFKRYSRMLLETAGVAPIVGDRQLTTPDERTATSEARDLVLRARAGDLYAFEQLMVCFQKQVLCTAARILRQHEDAKDAAQEVFLKLYRHLWSIQPDSVRSWLYRVTVNVCRDMTRKSMRFPAADLEDDALERKFSLTGSRQAETSIQLEQQREILQSALQELPFKERAAVVLRDIEGLSTEETARILKSSETTVRSQISSARVKIKRYCERALRRTI
jgi:RNA polymerase sigma-70 factor (ECF subfamily)